MYLSGFQCELSMHGYFRKDMSDILRTFLAFVDVFLYWACVCFCSPWQVANYPGSVDPPPSDAAADLQRNHHPSGRGAALAVPGGWRSRPAALLGPAWSLHPDVGHPACQSHRHGHQRNPPYHCDFTEWPGHLSLCGLQLGRCCQCLRACTRVLVAPGDTPTQRRTPALVSGEACLCSLLCPRCSCTNSALANPRWDSGPPIPVSPWQPLCLAQWDAAHSKSWVKGLRELWVHGQ